MLGLSLGALAAGRLGSHPWSDGYPALLADVEELERLYSFAKDERRMDDYVARLKGKVAQRGEALNELRVAVAFQSLGYPIIEWEPVGNNGKRGEYWIRRNSEEPIFVEVKSPGWEGELTSEERRAGRAKQPKYMMGERRGGPLATWQQVRACITRAYPKFAPSQQNLLVIAEDYRVPLDDEQMAIALYNPNALLGCPEYGLGCFASHMLENIGCVARFTNTLLSSRNYFSDCYRLRFYPNPSALKQLPAFR